MTQWLSMIIPVLMSAAAMLITWGAMRESVKRLSDDIKKMKDQIDVMTEIKILVAQLNKSAEKLHDRQDEFETRARRLERSIAVFSDRSDRSLTNPYGIPITEPAAPRHGMLEQSSPPRTKTKKEED